MIWGMPLTDAREELFYGLPSWEVVNFIWMIASVWETLIGRNFPHALHHSYLNEALEKQEDHNLHLPFSHDVHLLSYTWRKSLEDRFIAYHFQPWWRLLKEKATRRRGEILQHPYSCLRTSNNWEGENIMFLN